MAADAALNILTRKDGQNIAADDIESVATGAPEVSQPLQNAKRGIKKIQNGVEKFGNAMVGVDASSDTHFDGSAGTAGGAAGFAERKAEAEIAERKKSAKPNLFTRFTDTSDTSLNLQGESKGLTEPDFNPFG